MLGTVGIARGRVRHLFALGTVLAGILLAGCPCAFALDPSLDVSQYAHTAWKIRDGFFKGIIISIAQTPDGYLWLGTEFGLLRFDGVRAIPWQPPPGAHLPSNEIWSLLAAHDGTLWIGTSKGLVSWKGGKLTQYPELAGQGTVRLLEDHEDTVWAGFASILPGRLCAIQKRNVQCYGEDGLGEGVFGLYEDSKGNLWVGVRTGLLRWKPGPHKFYPLPSEVDGIRALAEGDDGALLVGWHGGIHRFVDGKTQVFPLPSTIRQFYAERLLRDHDGGLWIGTAESGLMHVRKGGTDVFAQSDGLSGEHVIAFFEDREGSVWAATLSGLDRFRDCAVATFSTRQGLSSTTPLSVLAARDGSVWLGTIGGLNRWRKGQITNFGKRDGKLNGQAPNSLFEDARGRIWVSTPREFGYLQNDRFVSIKGMPEGVVYSVAQDNEGSVWVAHDLGLFQLLRGRVVQQIPWSELGHTDRATALAADPLHSGLWLGFLRGGVAYFKNDQVRESYATAKGLGESRVESLQFDREGTLWAASEGGLSRLKNGRTATLTSKNGLPCDAVHWAIEDDEHSLWLYTACGLVKIARSDVEAWVAAADSRQEATVQIQVKVFDGSDGVRSQATFGYYHPQVAKTPDGKLWFLPWDGVSVIDPRHIPFNEIPPPIHIEQIVANRKTYDTTSDTNGSLRLPPLIRDVEIDYTALSLVAPEKIRFRYKLEGLDHDWHEAGNRRQAFYTDLPPRHYRFRVAACNNSGVWNEAGAFLDLSVAPAYYQTNWFRALCVAAFLTLVWVLYRLRIQQVRRQERKLRDVIETIPTFAWTTLPDGSVDFVNRHWQEYTGLSTENTVGSGWQAAVHPEDLERHREKWRASLATGERFENEVRYRRATDGQYRCFLTRAVPLRDARGHILKWYGISTDIEDRKRAEQLQADLAHVNRVSTMGELTASLAHEIKQPIGAAVTNAEACARLLDRDQPDVFEAREAALEMAKDATRAANIIDRVRSLYRKGSPQMETVDVSEVIGEMFVIFHNEANRHSVNMRTDLAEGLPRVMADRVQLQQVLMNLMLNGIQAMEEIGGLLTIKTQLDQDGRVQISVSDTGVGLPADKAEQIFDAFFTTKPEGSGMGLAISRSIIESHGGRVWVAANSGKGAAFHFTLPAAAPAVQGGSLPRADTD
jgi:PAS domain S-box-containing protein